MPRSPASLRPAPPSTKEEERPHVFHQLPPHTLPISVSAHPAVRRVAQILQNGTRFSGHAQIRFTAHTGLLIQLENAYNQRARLPIEEAEQRFLDVLQTYLEQAETHIPQAARKEEIPGLIGQLRAILHESGNDGLTLLGRYLLALAHAPLDRF